VALSFLEVARSQLLTAIDLFFHDRDPVSVHTLAGAAQEILEGLCREQGIDPMHEDVRASHPGKSPRELRAAFNLYRNAFKHVGRDEVEQRGHLGALGQFTDEANDFLLYVCVEDYLRLNRRSPIPMQVLQVWFCAVHSDRLVPDWEPSQFIERFPGMLSCDRAAQKRLGKLAVRQFLHDPDLLSDPRTEAL
jgi:hypothetical protein